MTASQFYAAVGNLGSLSAAVSAGDGSDVMQAFGPTPLAGGTSRDPAIAISFDLKVTR